METPIGSVSDWDGVLRHFGLEPAEFQVVDDTVRMSSWQQSKRLENGERDLVWLYSYKARFQRVTDRLPAADLAALTETVRRWRPPAARRTPGAGLGAPSTLFVSWADWQIGKGAGGGAAGTSQRVLDSFEKTLGRLKELRRAGRNVTSLSVWNMGDPTEGCEGNYANQLATTDLNRREQLNMALDLWLVGLRALVPLFDDAEFGSVLCNHGQWTRSASTGGKPATDDSDNIGGYLADTVRTVLTGRKGFEHLRYAIPKDEITMSTVMSGVDVALAHGHTAPTGSKAELEWLRGQSLRLLRERRVEPRLWMVAHRHHYEIKDYGPWHRIQMPSQDYGSKWLTDIAGVWSSPGAFTCLVGEHEQAGGPLTRPTARGFSDEMVLLPNA